MRYSRVEKYYNKTYLNKRDNINKEPLVEEKNKTKKRLKKPVKILILFLIIIFILTYFIITYSKEVSIGNIKTNEYNIKSNLITENFHGTKIVHFSDIHYGTTINNKLLEKIVEDINLTKPDIVIFTGDLFDESIEIDSKKVEELSSILNEITSVYGKYAIKGDNDYNDNFSIILENSGFIDISDSYDCIYNEEGEIILLTGLSSNIKNEEEISKKLESVYEFLNSNDVTYSILALHEPDFIDKIDLERFNLILSGHTLGGEIKLPIIGGTNYPKYGKKYTKSYYKIGSTEVYISNGLGTTDLKMRLFNNPSFNLYRLITK